MNFYRRFMYRNLTLREETTDPVEVKNLGFKTRGNWRRSDLKNSRNGTVLSSFHFLSLSPSLHEGLSLRVLVERLFTEWRFLTKVCFIELEENRELVQPSLFTTPCTGSGHVERDRVGLPYLPYWRLEVLVRRQVLQVVERSLVEDEE